MAKTIYVLNGPNMNLLGTREPEKYGRATLADVEKLCAETANRFGMEVVCRQSNKEGELVDWIQEARKTMAGIVFNPAAYSFTSMAILDALKASQLPIVEVHITNIHRREEHYHHSYVSKIATAVIAGLGPKGYGIAVRAICDMLRPVPTT